MTKRNLTTEGQAQFELLDRIDTITTNLVLIPSIIQTLIDDLHLDQKHLTEEELGNIMLGTRKINSVLALTQLTIVEALEKIEALHSELRSEEQS